MYYLKTEKHVSSYRNTREVLGEREMLWEHDPWGTQNTC